MRSGAHVSRNWIYVRRDLLFVVGPTDDVYHCILVRVLVHANECHFAGFSTCESGIEKCAVMVASEAERL
jgi:hypothetical protein